jgi:hypothetical protein
MDVSQSQYKKQSTSYEASPLKKSYEASHEQNPTNFRFSCIDWAGKWAFRTDAYLKINSPLMLGGPWPGFALK